jgi:hypothetical protein
MDQSDPDKCFASCRKRNPQPAKIVSCEHLGDAIGVVKVECGTCRGRVLVKWPVHVCEFVAGGRCLPTFIPADLTEWEARKPESDIYRLCHGCSDFVQNATQSQH